MDRNPVLIDLALQGGGSHGAFTWGVLDRLLEEPWLRIAGISGTSAGAMNAAVLADGWTDGGSPIKLFITATSVRTGRGRIFRNAEITADVLLASACLPTMFRAVEIDGEAYWDGGFTGNPTITPLVRETDAHDSILVQINPRERQETPRTARDILNRLNEVSFNSPLMKELRMIALLRQVADPGTGEGARWAQMRTHRIMTDMLAQFGASSKLNAEWEFVATLRAEGRRAASEFLDANGNDLGKRSTADLDALLTEC